METVRRTVTMPAPLAAAVDAAVTDGAADSVSAFIAAAVRGHLDQLADDRMATQAAQLDPATELAVIDGARPGRQPGWARLT